MRPFERADIGVLTGWYQNPDLMRYIGEGRPYTSAEVEMALRRYIEHTARDGFGLMFVERRETGEPVGRAGFKEWDVDGESLLEIGWLIAPSHQGQGYATEIGKTLKSHGFTELGRTVLISLIQHENTASVGVTEKVGGTWWKEWVTPGGQPVDLYRYERPIVSGDGDADESG